MRTPLGIVKGLGPAREGTHHWWVQRATSAALFPLTVWFITSIATLVGSDYQAIVIWVKNPLTTVLLVLFTGFVFYHLRIGVQVILDDYANSRKAKLTGLFLNDAFCLIFGLLTIFSILRIFLGS